MERIRKAALLVVLVGLVSGCTFLEKPITTRMKVTAPVPRPYAVKPSTIMVNNINLTYLEAGQQGPWVVLIHGGVIPFSAGSSFMVNPLVDTAGYVATFSPFNQSVLHSGALATADSWNYNLQAIADAGFRVVALDLPGFGGSDKPDLKYTVEDFILYLDAFLKAKGIEKASLVGHGLGGEIAIAYTLAHPEKVDRLVLVDSFGGISKRRFLNTVPRMVTNFIQGEKAAKINIFLPLWKRVFGDWKKPQEGEMAMVVSQKIDNPSARGNRKIIVSREGNSGQFLKAIIAYKLSWITTVDARKEIHAYHLALAETRRRDFAAKLSDLKVPVLIIRGFYDPIIKPEQAEFMASVIPQSQLIIYNKSGHYPMVEEAQRFNQDVIFFLSGRIAGPATVR